MNKYMTYDGYEQWYQPMQTAEPSQVERLSNALAAVSKERGGIDADPIYHGDRDAIQRSPDYNYKAACYNDPLVIESLQKKGVRYISTEMGGVRYMILSPIEVQAERLPIHIVIHNEEYSDPFWAMKTLRLFREYISGMPKLLVFIIANHGRLRKVPSIITKGIREYCGDQRRIYFDLSVFLGANHTLSELDGFIADGLAEEQFDHVPVVNMAWHWQTAYIPDDIGANGDGSVDRERLIHSAVGQRRAWILDFVRKYKTWQNPAAASFWEKQGLRLDTYHIDGERWAIFTPLSTGLDALPVVVCFFDVSEPKEYSILEAYGEYRAYCDIAAHGECAVIFFSLENADLNDLICDILKDAAEKYPLDPGRVYLTGHSRNGVFVQEFARRHPDIVAAIAPIGNTPGLDTPAVSHDAVPVDDGRAALMATLDMPTCILCGCKEVGCLIPVNQPGHTTEPGISIEGYGASVEGRTAMWNRRLIAERCEPQKIDDMKAAQFSKNRVFYKLGFPADRTEVLWLDGFEHYIADIRNKDGKYHFRIVGVEEQPHTILYSMHQCGWNFMRRFARNQETGAVIELFEIN